MNFRSRLLISSLLFLVFAAVCTAHIAHFDDYWQSRAEEANAHSQASYHPEPEHVLDDINGDVINVITRNNTRRSLHGKAGRKFRGQPCVATNPIDRCWRCRKNWATPIQNRKRLAKCAKGFGRHTTGGLDGEFYTVTDPIDDDLLNPRPGTLRHAVIQDVPLWIIFDRSMIIKLDQELILTSNKTIDGRGANVHIAGGSSFNLQFVHNIIIHNIHIHDIVHRAGGDIADSVHHHGTRTRSDGDGISIIASTNLWIDHVSIRKCDDGVIDIIENSTAITVSNGHYTDHTDVMLFGARDENYGDKVMQVTVAFNHYGSNLIQRMPRSRYGFVHVLNNDYTHWLMYAIGGSSNPTVVCQGNRFSAPMDVHLKEITKRMDTPEEVWRHWTWISQGDVMRNGAYFRASGATTIDRKFNKGDFIKYKPGEFAGRLTRYAGTLPCIVGLPC